MKTDTIKERLYAMYLIPKKQLVECNGTPFVFNDYLQCAKICEMCYGLDTCEPIEYPLTK